MSSPPLMAFHAPYPLDLNPTAASRLRPLRMRQAFTDLGYEVVDLTGTVAQRRAALRDLRSRLRAGTRPELLYSENSTQPNALATSVKNGFAPRLDYAIMRQARRYHVPVGVFYRDAYWRVPETRSSGVRGALIPALQRLDLVGYRRNKVHFFLPSEPMSKLVGLGGGDSFSALPPATDPGRVLGLPPPGDGLNLVYVGGLGGHYDLGVFLQSLTSAPGVHLDLVTCPEQWRAAVHTMPELSGAAVSVHHKHAGELAPLYAGSHIGVFAIRPSAYLDIAVPVKLFEYIGYGRPIIATRGTEAGRIVEANGVGWVVDHERSALTNLLIHLRNHPQEVADRAAAAVRMAESNTWADRARTVRDVLTGVGATG